MPSVLRELSKGLPHGDRQQWLRHVGDRQRQRNLKRLQREALAEQGASCEWLADGEQQTTAEQESSGAAAVVPTVP